MWSFQALVAFVLSAFGPEAPQLTLDLSPDARVLAYAVVLTLATGVLFGLLPALRASRPDLHTAMKGGASSGQRSESRLQGTLVGVQVAVCMVLVIGASLLLRGLYAAQTVEPGFRYEDVAVVAVSLEGRQYDGDRGDAFRRELAERVAAVPGVDTVAQALRSPLSEGTVQMQAALPGQQPFAMDLNYVSATYFSLLDLPLAVGRAFTAADEVDLPTAAIVTEATARRLWPDRNPLGQRLSVEIRPNQPSEVEVVGIARDAEITTIGAIPSSYLYLPAAPRMQRELLVRSRSDFAALAPQIRTVVAELDPGVAARVAPLEANLDFWRSLAGVVSTLAAGLGAVALVLAVVGVYGVVAHAVGRRVREIAIRVALGANRRDVVALVLRETMRPVAIGIALGIAASLSVSRVLSSVLFGIGPADGVALVCAAVVVVSAALAAGIFPARRASRADPNTVLHHE
jgi:predicted permease